MDMNAFLSTFTDRLNKFSTEVCEDRRYFLSDESSTFLDDLWSYLGQLKSPNGRDIVLTIPQDSDDSIFYRARAHGFDPRQNDYIEKGFPLSEMKPVKNIRSEGRLNPYNISMLYVASDPMTAVSECRADARGLVSVGKFKATRDLKILDLAHEFNWDAYFDASTIDLEPLYDLGHLFTRPLDNDSKKGREYLVTQVLAEYFKIKCDLDGISYLSQFSSFDRSNTKNMKTNLSTIAAVTTGQTNYCLFDLDSAECVDIEVWRLLFRTNIMEKVRSSGAQQEQAREQEKSDKDCE